MLIEVFLPLDMVYQIVDKPKMKESDKNHSPKSNYDSKNYES